MRTSESRRFSCLECKTSFDLALSPASSWEEGAGDAKDRDSDSESESEIEIEASFCPFCASGELKMHQDSPTVATPPSPSAATIQEFRMKHLDYHRLDLATALAAAVHLKATDIPYELIEHLSIPGEPAGVHRLVFDENNRELVMSVLETWECLPKPSTTGDRMPTMN